MENPGQRRWRRAATGAAILGIAACGEGATAAFIDGQAVVGLFAVVTAGWLARRAHELLTRPVAVRGDRLERPDDAQVPPR